MKNVVLGLFLILAISGFAIAEPTSSVRADFYVNAPLADSSEHSFIPSLANWKSLIIYGCTILIIVVILLKVLRSKKKIKKRMKKSKKIKAARHKK